MYLNLMTDVHKYKNNRVIVLYIYIYLFIYLFTITIGNPSSKIQNQQV